MMMSRLEVLVLILMPLQIFGEDAPERVKEPSLCEVCKFLTVELKDRLQETGKSKEILETGQGIEKKRKFKYNTSELRFIEALTDPHVCEKILEYNIHAEKKGSARYAKGRSETMETLHGLVNKGVKVELGMPYEMWDKPSAEVTHMQRKCFSLVEDYEEDLEEWYYHHQDRDLTTYLCSERVLRSDDTGCLREEEHDKKTQKLKQNLKGDPGTDLPSEEDLNESDRSETAGQDGIHHSEL